MMGHAMVAGGNPAMKAPVASILASDLAVGSIVKLMEGGVAVEYLVVNQGKPSGSSLYDDSCDGTWLLRKHIIENRVWDDGNVNKLESSDIHSWLNSTMLLKFDENAQNAINLIKIPYRKGGGTKGTFQTGENGLQCKVFLLSRREVGDGSTFDDGAKLAFFELGSDTSAKNKRIAYIDGNPSEYWLRSVYPYSTDYVYEVLTSGIVSNTASELLRGIRPALVIQKTALFERNSMVLIGVA